MMTKWYAIALNKKKGCLVGAISPDKKRVKELLPLYKKKGWTGGIIRVNPPNKLSEQEKQDLKEVSEAIRIMNGIIMQEAKRW